MQRIKAYIKELDDGWYAFGTHQLYQDVYNLKDPSRTAPWSEEAIRELGLRSPSRAAATARANRWGMYYGSV